MGRRRGCFAINLCLGIDSVQDGVPASRSKGSIVRAAVAKKIDYFYSSHKARLFAEGCVMSVQQHPP